jgi:hypothetical protein
VSSCSNLAFYHIRTQKLSTGHGPAINANTASGAAPGGIAAISVSAIVTRRFSSDDGREDLKDDTLAEPNGDAPTRRGVVASTRQVCAISEAANSTLLTPLRAQYHNVAVKSLLPEAHGRLQEAPAGTQRWYEVAFHVRL